MTPDPFTVAHNAVWTSLEAAAVEEDVELVVKEGNRIKLTEKGQLRESVSPAQAPELMLSMTSLIMQGGNSDSRKMTVIFSWMASSNTYRAELAMYPLMWQLCRGVEHLDANKGTYLIGDPDPGPQKPFITGVEVPDALVTDTDPKLNRGLKGFSSIFSVQLELYVPQGLL